MSYRTLVDFSFSVALTHIFLECDCWISSESDIRIWLVRLDLFSLTIWEAHNAIFNELIRSGAWRNLFCWCRLITHSPDYFITQASTHHAGICSDLYTLAWTTGVQCIGWFNGTSLHASAIITLIIAPLLESPIKRQCPLWQFWHS